MESDVERFDTRSTTNVAARVKYTAETGKPLVMSTGMGSLGEVERALDTIYKAGNEQVVLLHCTALYPPQLDEVNLRAMDALRCAFGVPVGYSDHTVGNAVSLAAVARGACFIEKHFTLDKSMPGPDQHVSGDPEDFARMVQDIRSIETALGDGRKKPVAAELDMRTNFRRSIVACQDIPAGATVAAEMICFKRPGSGISPADVDWVVGRTTRKPIAADSVVDAADLV